MNSEMDPNENQSNYESVVSTAAMDLLETRHTYRRESRMSTVTNKKGEILIMQPREGAIRKMGSE